MEYISLDDMWPFDIISRKPYWHRLEILNNFDFFGLNKKDILPARKYKKIWDNGSCLIGGDGMVFTSLDDPGTLTYKWKVDNTVDLLVDKYGYLTYAVSSTQVPRTHQ